ncbi:helix-turn-helix domain-containing protein [Streptomyces sp. NBC_01343]|uniref:helix-turn-helix domain-containing protein n=1 Tax=Streptomyces sp. NBC_01343 TaxID=2903832 RepID=UPI002E162063|nr:helix-turn-helix domain-containing protein [Streptomyces sp. NBC_01343]
MGGDRVRAAADRLLGRELRRCREARGLTLRQVAPVIRGAVSKISRLERGESPPRPRDVRDLARYYGVDADEMRAMERLLEQARDCEWNEQFSDGIPDFLKRLIQREGDGANYVTRARALDGYRNALANLRGAAASHDESPALILAARRRFGSAGTRVG